MRQVMRSLLLAAALAPPVAAQDGFVLREELYTFKKGHRVMVQVQSSWFPLIDRNPQKYVPNIFEARDSDFVAATHRIHRSKTRASRISIPVVTPVIP